ncbi:unnamed protein product [Spodoptera littoralis]|uniref:Uncharacterized protein n=1 Tax=Spodoptera littoralis TaxID=7109 RepID=A0A9P0IJ57_SPOLI|nr:unnamed protein product [Spodoptera littoralis]CAH1646772.1 unnamed protein product [Spodoptera littoralis]
MFLSKASVILLVAFLGTTWFMGDGFVSASPLPQGFNPMMNQNPNGFTGGPGYYIAPQPYYSPQPQPYYATQRPPLIRTWDGINDWAQNTVQGILGQNAVSPRSLFLLLN